MVRDICTLCWYLSWYRSNHRLVFLKNHWFSFIFVVVFISLNFYLGQIVRLGRVCRHVLDKIYYFFFVCLSLVFARYFYSHISCVCFFFIRFCYVASEENIFQMRFEVLQISKCQVAGVCSQYNTHTHTHQKTWSDLKKTTDEKKEFLFLRNCKLHF